MNKMKHLIGKKMFLSLIVLFSIPAVYAQEGLKINLNQALQIAMSESPTVKVADIEIEKKKYAKKEVQSGLWPTISASAGYTRTLKKQVMYMGGGGGGGLQSMIMDPLMELLTPLYQQHPELPFPPSGSGESTTESSDDGGMEVGLDNNWNAGFNLSIPIFAPSLYKSIKLTSLDIESSLEASRASRQDLVNQVSKAYYQLLLAQDSYDVLQRGYAQAEENFRIVNNKFEQGLVSEYDKIRADVQVRNLKPSLVQAKNAIVLTKLQLKVLMGIDTDIDLEVDGSLEDYEQQMYVDYLNVDTASLASNTDLRNLEIQSRMLDESLKLDRTAFMPTVALSASLQWTAMNDNFKFKDYKWNPYSMVGVTVSVPIFSGFKNTSKVKQTKLQIEQLDWNRINVERGLRMQMKSYVDNMNTSLEQLGSNKEGVRQAEKGRLIAQKRYEVGGGTIIELNDAEVALTQAKLAYEQAIFDFLTSKTDLDKVLGKDEYIRYENNN